MKAFALGATAALAGLVALAAGPAPKGSPTPKPTPTAATTGITLPADNVAFKPGAGAQTTTARCLICHSAAYVTTQPPLERAKWAAEVAKMRNVFGAPITDAEAAEITDYLTAAYGKPS